MPGGIVGTDLPPGPGGLLEAGLVAPPRRAAAHRAAGNTLRGPVVAIGVLVAIGLAVATLALLGPRPADGGPSLGLFGGSQVDVNTAQGAAAEPSSDLPPAVTCWDATRAPKVSGCPVPAGRDGMGSVFASLTDSCVRGNPRVPGKQEVFACRGKGYVVRYTRWQPGFDRFSYYRQAQDTTGKSWAPQGRFAGRTWSSVDKTADDRTHWRWSATYRAWPLSVEVQSNTVTGRAAGVESVVVAGPLQVARG